MQMRDRFVDSTPLLGDDGALRARGEQDGYLYFNRQCPSLDLPRPAQLRQMAAERPVSHPLPAR